MRIILNLIPLKTGGGVQVALDFLKQAESYGKDHQWFIVARKNGPFSDYKSSSNINSIPMLCKTCIEAPSVIAPNILGVPASSLPGKTFETK